MPQKVVSRAKFHPANIKQGINYVDYKRHGNSVKVILNGTLIKDFNFDPAIDPKVDWT